MPSANISVTQITQSAEHASLQRSLCCSNGPRNNINNNNSNHNNSDNHTDRCNSRFYNLLTAPRHVSNMYTQVARAQSRANHVQRICLSHATCHVPHGTKGQLSCQVWQIWNCIYSSFILLTEIINWWRINHHYWKHNHRKIKKQNYEHEAVFCESLHGCIVRYCTLWSSRPHKMKIFTLNHTGQHYLWWYLWRGK